jgi:Na+-driven multidrug efflux pump
MKRLDLGSSHTWHNIFALALPAMLAQLVSVLYSIVDRIYVSNIGGNEGALSLIGVGVCAPICSFITSFGFWVGLGGGPLLSISLGEKKEENAKRILATAFWLCLILSLMLMLFCYLFLKPMLLAFGASEASYPYAYRYMKWYLMGNGLRSGEFRAEPVHHRHGSPGGGDDYDFDRLSYQCRAGSFIHLCFQARSGWRGYCYGYQRTHFLGFRNCFPFDKE